METGLALHKMSSVSMGDNTGVEASCRPCAVVSAAQSGGSQYEFEIKTLLCDRDMFCARKFPGTCLFHFWGLHQMA